jgi:cell wall-associated NlpC family hydrolase
MFAPMSASPTYRFVLCLPCALVLAACATAPVPHSAAPEPDTVAEFLIERGLAPPATPLPAPPAGEIDNTASTAPSPPERDPAATTVVTAMSFLGVGYRRGGDSVDLGFDCSGFTRHVYGVSLGLTLPRRADEQAQAPDLRRVARDALQPGDLVFFNTLGRTFSHVGIYVGEGRFIHAPRTGARVRVESMDSPYWRKRYTGARRAEILAASAD